MLTIDLRDRVALIVGGSRGIGAGVTRAVARAGAITVFTHTGNPTYADRVVALLQDLRTAGDDVHAVIADACDAAQMQQTVRHIVEQHGRLDVLVCNVGRNIARRIEDTSDADWDESLRLNLSSAFYAIRAALPAMLEAGIGKIILIGSSAGFDGGGGALDYAAAKAGLTGAAHYLTRNYAHRGILTNVIHPSVIETDLLRERYADSEKRAALIRQVPVGRLGTPADVAGLAAFLASPWGDFICGQEFLVDGGRTLFRR